MIICISVALHVPEFTNRPTCFNDGFRGQFRHRHESVFVMVAFRRPDSVRYVLQMLSTHKQSVISARWAAQETIQGAILRHRSKRHWARRPRLAFSRELSPQQASVDHLFVER